MHTKIFISEIDSLKCFILSTGTRIRIDSVIRRRSSSRSAIQVPQLQLQLQ